MELRGDLAAALEAAHPELEAVRAAAGEVPVYLVGGAVRDLLLDRERTDVDLVVVGDAAELAAKLGSEPVEHARFATAKVELDGHEVDLASARSETYPRPGALPEVAPAGDIETDLARRDFTINAMALTLQGDPDLIDPHGGKADLEADLLRILHPSSFEDDPTRALRAARYAARFNLHLEIETEGLLRKADLTTVSAARREAELLRLAAEPGAPRAFELLSQWGLIELRPGGVALVEEVGRLLSAPPWQGLVPRRHPILAAACGSAGPEQDLVAQKDPKPSEGVELARCKGPIDLILARALGAEWLDRYMGEWRAVRLEIDGDDLIVAGVPEGPAVGAGLAEALRRKLDGEIDGREEELETALAAARAEAGN